jgi:hypothetical protein
VTILRKKYPWGREVDASQRPRKQTPEHGMETLDIDSKKSSNMNHLRKK